MLLENPGRLTGAALLASVVLGGSSGLAAQEASRPKCEAVEPLVRIAELPEASGLTLSSFSPDRLWSHNDSGEAVLVALDTKGSVMERIRLPGVRVDDWEAVAVGPCPRGSCVLIADIGDNNAKRERITVYRLPESSAERGMNVADTFHATYPDGPHDAETLLVDKAGRLYIVTKGDAGPVALYRFPSDMTSGGTYEMERVGQAHDVSESDWITDGAFSPDDRWVILRTRNGLRIHPAADLLAGNWTEAGRVDLKSLGERQGEGIAIAGDGTVYLTGEGGGGSQPGSFARIRCSFEGGPQQ